MKRALVLVVVALTVSTSFVPSQAARGCRRPSMHAAERHSEAAGHRRSCGLRVVLSYRVSKDAGLGRMELNQGRAAILQRDEGIVTLIDLRNPFASKVLGRYDDGAEDSLDGDLAFSSDGEWLFYARQTVQFSQDGVHVLNVSDPTTPTLASYQPGGGAFRIAYYKADDAEYVIVLDAVDGLVINRFVRESGTLVKVFQDAEPALKVGGPASAGLFVVRKDRMTGAPLLYVTTGQTGLQVYDLSQPEAPPIVGTWDGVGLAEVEVVSTKKKRTVYAATEYWFDKTLRPAVMVLDATDLGEIRRVDRWSLGLPADDLWRVQGMDRYRGALFVAHSHAGVVAFDDDGSIKRWATAPFAPHAAAGAIGAGYAMDVELRRPYGILVTDAATGRLALMVRPRPPLGTHGRR